MESKDCIWTYEISLENQESFFAGKFVTGFRKKDHRKIYLDFVGEISGGRGYVEILWKGFYEPFEPKEILQFFLRNRKIVVHINRDSF